MPSSRLERGNLQAPQAGQRELENLQPSSVAQCFEVWQVHCAAEHDYWGETMLGGRPAAFLKEYWGNVQHQEWGRAHPLFELEPTDREHTIPIVYHVDGVEFSNSGEAHCWSWASALSKGATWHTKRLAGLLVTESATGQSVQDMVAFFVWSGQALLSGCFPLVDHLGQAFPAGSWRGRMAGQPLAGPWRGAFVGTKHDLKARAAEHRLHRHYGANFICDLCLACKHIRPLWFTDFGSEAPWRGTLFSHERYLQTTPLADRSPWCAMPGFHNSRMLFDVMHTMHLGTDKVFIASALLALSHYAGGADLDGHLSHLFWQMRTAQHVEHVERCPAPPSPPSPSVHSKEDVY